MRTPIEIIQHFIDEFQEALDHMPEVKKDRERTRLLEAKIYLLESVKLAIELEQQSEART